MHATSPVALVTGGARGIGHEVTRQLAASGCVVYAGVRDPDRAADTIAKLAVDADVRPVRLDVTDERSIASAVDTIDTAVGRIDILINNAGISPPHGDPLGADVADVRRTYETNVFGVIAVTQACLPLLLRSAPASVVNVSSAMGSLALWSDDESPIAAHAPLLLAYNTSKTALNAVTVAYARAARQHGIRVNSADPGYVATDLNGRTGTRTVAEGARIIVNLARAEQTGTFQSDFGPVPW